MMAEVEVSIWWSTMVICVTQSNNHSKSVDYSSPVISCENHDIYNNRNVYPKPV